MVLPWPAIANQLKSRKSEPTRNHKSMCTVHYVNSIPTGSKLMATALPSLACEAYEYCMATPVPDGSGAAVYRRGPEKWISGFLFLWRGFFFCQTPSKKNGQKLFSHPQRGGEKNKPFFIQLSGGFICLVCNKRHRK